MSQRAIAAYADSFNRRYTCTPGVSSSLGAWLLLALVAPLATGAERDELERHLGVGADEAAGFATRLLTDQPDVVRTAVALWADETATTDVLATWRPPGVERGPVPDQDAADAWTARATDGLIERFPAGIDPDTVLLMTSALATRLTWATPLDTAPDGRLVLRHGRGRQCVVDTRAAGPVAVASPDTGTGLRVMSVIAAPGVPPEAVHRAAQEVADGAAVVAVPEPGHSWSVTERRERRATHDVDVTHEWTTTLPAWSAESRHTLTDGPGLPAALAVLGALVPPGAPTVGGALQAAVASYSATGFEAAAVTAMVLGRAAPPPVREVLVRDVRVDFDRPHAVLAVMADGWPPGAWDGLPVFSAWVDPVTS